MNERDLAAELAEARDEIDALRQRLDSIEARATSLPQTMLLDDSFIKRAFAVMGHYLVAGLIVAIPFYLIFLMFLMVFGVFA